MQKVRKEEEKFAPSCVMEGIVSVRAVISGRESGVNARNIERVLFDETKKKTKSRELSYLNEKSKEHGFEICFVKSEEIDKMTIGSSHGGIVALCSERVLRPISDDDIAPRGFFVMLEGIEDPYNEIVLGRRNPRRRAACH